MELSELGERICIVGPSNSGKSTLAAAISRKIGLPLVHLDQLHHYPDTAWQMRPNAEFQALHQQAIEGEQWVIEGNYSKLLPSRLGRATGLIVLDVAVTISLVRYINRTLWQKHRYGGVTDNDRLSWEMLHYIARVMPPKVRHNASICSSWPGPALWLNSPRQLNQYYRQWHLER